MRAARVRPCPECGQRTLTGLDDDACALTARVDPTPLTYRQELACVVVGRTTYWLDSAGWLHRRSARAVLYRECSRAVAEHDCAHPIPPEQVDQVADDFLILATAPDDTPPF